MSNSYPGGVLTAGADTSYSVAFDGDGDSLTAPQGAPFQFPADFTMECWLYANNGVGGASYDGVFDTRASNSASSNSAGVNYKDNGYLNMYVAGANTASSILLGSDRWVHVALVRSGSTVTLYQNGISVASASTSANLSDGYFTIGGFVSAGYWRGYISNVRVVKGTAVYTSNFTPPPQLFTIPGTSILTCQSPTIIDNSGNNVTITTNGNAAVSNFTPFAGYKGFNPALGAAAGGVWTLEQASSYQSNRTWPIYDPYFKNTTLLLHGNGTNGANNNSFIDSSSNNFAITRNGNATQGTFSPFSQTGWSAYNSGSSSYCQLNNADYSLGTGDFTVECWMFVTTDKANNAICTSPSNPNFGVLFGGGSSNARSFYLEYASAVTTIGTISGFLNKWTHIAVVRSGGICTVYQNGVSVGSASKAGSVGSTANLYLLRNSGDAGQDFPGYITDLRITKAAVYTSNFIPNTKPLTVAPNTLLLTFQSNRFVDNSALNTTVTPTATTIQAFSPFVPAYITPTTYSNYFDGSGDYISTSDASTACAFPGGTDFTIECWFNNVATVSDGTIWSTSSAISASEQIRLDGGANNNTLRVISTYTTKITASATYSNSTWNHIAVVRSGTTLTLYQNGINVGSVSNNQSFTADAFTIGSNGGGGGPFPFNGLVSNLRVVKGTALYTTNFTPPSAPLVAIPGTQLLTCQDSTFKDNSTNNFTITATGDAKPVTSPTPFPAKVDTTTLNAAYSTSLIGGSAYFDGTGDYLRTPTDVAFALSTSDFTFETWLYPTVNGNDSVIIDNRNPSGGTNGFAVSWATSNYVRVIVGAPNTWDVDQSTAAVGTNSWTHYALTRSGTTFRIFLNGALVYTSGSISGSLGTTAVYATMGAAYNGANPFTGYFSGTRLIKGTALYTSSFAPPVAPPTPVTNTSVLLNYTNAGIVDSTSKNVVETVNGAQLSTAQRKFGSSSMYFEGVSPYSHLKGNANLARSVAFGTGDFTVECWVYLTTTASDSTIMDSRPGSNSANYFLFYLWTQGGATQPTIAWYAPESYKLSTGASISGNTWTHVAVTRSSGTIRSFKDGIMQQSAADTTNYADPGAPYPYIGANYGAGTDSFKGYINDLRVTRGVARYTSNFIPQTSVWQNQ